MEASIVAAIGSFVVSEKVIKFKAYIIFGLLCTVFYDLSIYTNDPVSLRVYRGPALIALSLICAAFCLRTWRRNGVACDELLFLPGSIYDKANLSNSDDRKKRLANRLPLNMRNGHGHVDDLDQGNTNIHAHTHTIVTGGSGLDVDTNGSSALNDNEEENMIIIGSKSIEKDTSLRSLDDGVEEPMMEMVPLTISRSDCNSMDAEGETQDESMEPTALIGGGINTGSNSPTVNGNSNSKPGETSLWRHIACRSQRFLLRRSTSSSIAPESPKRSALFVNTTITLPLAANTTIPVQQRGTSGGLGGFIAKFFSSSKESNEYAPSGPAVASASLDLCMPVLFNFHLFIMATNDSPAKTGDSADANDSKEGMDDDGTSTYIAPQILPLLFLSMLSIRAILPPKSRRRFWGTIKSAIISPFVGITFRDELIGEVFTSLVRPMQDLSFALFYYFSSIYGILCGNMDLKDTGKVIEESKLLHNFLLPICAVLPLFCRFLQTLRQAFDDQQRWPHLGNAFKYLTSSLVIVYGLTHAEDGRNICWYWGFVACVAYQIWWDVFVDWELLVPSPNDRSRSGGSDNGSADESKDELLFLDSTVGASSSWNHWINRYFARMKLRPQRLFKSKKTYWHVLILNSCIRFCWMLAFIPAYHWNTRTERMEKTSSVDARNIMGFLISIAELLRRCCWVILRLELETIKLTDREYTSTGGNPYFSLNNTGAGGSGGWNSQVQYTCLMPRGDGQSALSPIGVSSTMAMKWTAYRLLAKKLFCLELFLWVVAYLGLVFWVQMPGSEKNV